MRFDFEELKQSTKSGRDVSLFGAFPADETLHFRVRINKKYSPHSVAMIIHADGWNSGSTEIEKIEFEITTNEDVHYVEFCKLINFADLSQRYRRSTGLYYYHYEVNTERDTIYLGGEHPIELIEIPEWIGERQLLLHLPEYCTSSAFKNGIMYHIFVDRFSRSGRCSVKSDAILNPDWDNGIPQYGEYPGAEVANNEFFGGDLYGITEKLEYIASLGVTTIYLSPVFDAYSNHKYDIGDYMNVDSMFGGDKALCELCSRAKEYDIDVILDGVFNHTGADSIYFNKFGKYHSIGAYESPDSPYYSWYKFKQYPDEYECWWGVKILPHVDSANQEYCDFICKSVVPKWMDCGVSGWRIDVADELSNTFLDQFRKAVKEKNPDGVIIGEVWEDASDKVSYGYRRRYFEGSQLDSVMNYPLRDAIIEYVKNGDHERFRRYTEGTYRRYPKQTSDNLMNFLGSHDTERILTILGGVSSVGKVNNELAVMRMTDSEYTRAVSLLKFAYSILVGLPGVPCIYYGDEVGVEGYHDPFCRMPFPWNSIDRELLAHYQKLGAIRKQHEVFRDGIFRLISATHKHIVYLREPVEGDGDSILVAACREGELELNLPDTCRCLNTNSVRIRGKAKICEGEVRYFICPNLRNVCWNIFD